MSRWMRRSGGEVFKLKSDVDCENKQAEDDDEESGKKRKKKVGCLRSHFLLHNFNSPLLRFALYLPASFSLDFLLLAIPSTCSCHRPMPSLPLCPPPFTAIHH